MPGSARSAPTAYTGPQTHEMSLLPALAILQQGLVGLCPDEASANALEKTVVVFTMAVNASQGEVLSGSTKQELTECDQCACRVPQFNVWGGRFPPRLQLTLQPSFACRKIIALAQQLALLDQSLAGDPFTAPGRLMNVHAACAALHACIRIGTTLSLSPSDAFRLAAAARPVINAGTAALTVALADPRHARDLAVLGDRAAQQLGVVEGVLDGILVGPDYSRSARAFAATAANPTAAVDWLVTVTHTLDAATTAGGREGALLALMHQGCTHAWPQHVAGGTVLSAARMGAVSFRPTLCSLRLGAGLRSSAAQRYLAVTHSFITHQEFQLHSHLLASLAINERTQVARTLLTLCLPPLVEGMEAAAGALEESRPGSSAAASAAMDLGHQLGRLQLLEQCVKHPSLQAGLSATLQLHGSGRLVQLAVRLAAALPLSPPPGMERDVAAGHVAAGQLLAQLVLIMRLTLEQMRAAEQDAAEEIRAAEREGGSSMDAGSGSDGEHSSAQPDSNDHGGAECSAEGSGHDDRGNDSLSRKCSSSQHLEERRAAAWQVVRLLVPRMQGILLQAGHGPDSSGDMACMCQDFAVSITLWLTEGSCWAALTAKSRC